MPRALAIAWMLAACANEPSFELCGDAPILRAPAIGCETHTIVAGDDGQCPSDFPPADGARGSWVRLSRAEGAPGYVRITTASRGACDPATGVQCPFASTVDPDGTPCDCPLAGAHLRQVWWFEGGTRTFTMDRPEHSLVLGPTGQAFEIEVCRTLIDGYPVCRRTLDGDLCPPGTDVARSGGGCICAPRCRTAAVCTTPSTGSASVQCSSGQCVLGCALGETCPDGQVCLSRGETGAECFWPRWPP